MRNTAVLVKWIEEHQANPYPTKAEKQYLAYYSGMNLTQLSTWFANARRRIKKIGMKTWLEGRSTFTVDFFPAASAFTPSRANMAADYLNGSGESSIAIFVALLASCIASDLASSCRLTFARLPPLSLQSAAS